MGKKSLCLIFAFLLSINTFAAAVSDNDGSAFITKAEFDSLKNDFQTQLDSYNNQIDSKIDNAISSYLAGITFAKETTMQSNISIFSYPLKIVNYYKSLVDLDAPTAEQRDPFFTPGYQFYGGLHRAKDTNGSLGISLLTLEPSVKEKKWMNVTWNGNKCVINGMSGALDYWLTGAIYYDGDHQVNDADDEGGLIFCDFKSTGSAETGGIAYGGSRTAKSGYSLYANYDIYTHTRELFDVKMVGGIVSTLTDGYWGYTSTESLDPVKWKTPSGGTDKYVWINRCGVEDKLRSYTYNPVFSSNLDTVFNCGLYYDSTVTDLNNTTYKKYLAPVTFGTDQKIYLTNHKRYRKAIKQSDISKTGWWQMYTFNDSIRYPALGVITTGLNIESEYSTSPKTGTNAHPVKQRSAVKTNDLYYNFELESGLYAEHHMVDGVPILSVPSNLKEKLDTVTIEIDISGQKTTNAKYAIFSVGPITTQKYDTNVESNPNYLKVKKLNKTASGLRKVRLEEGKNEIEISAVDGNATLIKGGDVLLMKLLWEDATSEEEYVKLNNPATFVLKQKSE